MALNENKSGDSSLRDWFGKSKSSDGKLVGFSWVANTQKSCAKQPGQTTKPKCGSSKMKRALSKMRRNQHSVVSRKKIPIPMKRVKQLMKTEGVSTEGNQRENRYLY